MSKFLNSILGRYTDDDGLDFSNIVQDAGIAATAYGILNPNNSEGLGNFFGTGGQQQPVGYMGGIPNYTATQGLAPNAFTQNTTNPAGVVASRRPGSMGRRYFDDLTYTQSEAEPTMGMTQEDVTAQAAQVTANEELLDSLITGAANTRIASTGNRQDNEAGYVNFDDFDITGGASTDTIATDTTATDTTIPDTNADDNAAFNSFLSGFRGRDLVEADVGTMLSSGYSIAEIASGLGLGTTTLQDYVNHYTNTTATDTTIPDTTATTGTTGTTFPEGTDGNGVVSNSVLDGFGEVVNTTGTGQLTSAQLKQAVLDGTMDYSTAYGLLGIADAPNPFGFTEDEKLTLGISESQRTGQGYKYNSATGSTDLYNYDTGTFTDTTATDTTATNTTATNTTSPLTAEETLLAYNSDYTANADGTFTGPSGYVFDYIDDTLVNLGLSSDYTAGSTTGPAPAKPLPDGVTLTSSPFSNIEADGDYTPAEAQAAAQLINQNPNFLGEATRYFGMTEKQVQDIVNSLYPNTFAQGGAVGGQGYYLGGTTDGMADQIPATIDNAQPAALSDGEFVIPADVVSHLGNGNSDAGAQNLYSMMDRIREDRTGNPKQGRQIDPNKYLA
jgi:hypothetical protein